MGGGRGDWELWIVSYATESGAGSAATAAARAEKSKLTTCVVRDIVWGSITVLIVVVGWDSVWGEEG